MNVEGNQLPRMAPNLPESSHQMIRDMIISKCENVEIAEAVHCSRVTVQTRRKNLQVYGSTKAPPNGGGRKRSITPPMLDALSEYLQKRPGSYQYEMKDFLQKEFEVPVITSSIGRALANFSYHYIVQVLFSIPTPTISIKRSYLLSPMTPS